MADEQKAAAASKADRAAALLANRQAKMDALYKGQHYTIAGEVHIEDPDARFQTPFGNRGRHGFKLVNDNQDTEGDLRAHVVGASMLQLIAEQYGAVDIPPKERKRRTKEQKALDDAAEAEEKAVRKAEREAARAAKQEEKAKAAAEKEALKAKILESV